MSARMSAPAAIVPIPSFALICAGNAAGIPLSVPPHVIVPIEPPAAVMSAHMPELSSGAETVPIDPSDAVIRQWMR